uniref:Uncharacterized protein n=1 Tax=Tanacetum cinerariifolium TaxID=118510 RepID=A0A699K6G1_TANCI|nr:hypothetical protein [Tanacetum cinerariifolium]
MLQVHGETIQVDRKGLLNSIIVKVKDTWLSSALSLRGPEILIDPGIPDGQVVQTVILNNAAFQADDLDAYDSDCDDAFTTKAVLRENLSNYGSDVLFEIKPTLYDGSVISSQHAVIPVIDDEETLILEEVSRSKMLAKQNDLILKEKKINTTLINYVELNQLSEDFGKRCVPQQELSAKQAFWLQTSNPNTETSDI